MRNFLIAGTVAAALSLTANEARAVCVKTGVIYNVTAFLGQTIVSFRAPNLIIPPSVNFVGTIPNTVTTLNLVNTANQARANGATVTITGTVATCPPSGSIGNITTISY